MTRRGAYFFVIDSFIAATVVIAAIIVIYARYSPAGPAAQAFYTADDFMLVLATTHLNEIDSAQVRTWSRDGTINDTSLTLLEQLAYFNATGRDVNASTLANIALAAIPEQIGAEIFVGSKSYASYLSEQKGRANVFFSSKRIVIVRNDTSKPYPPILVEVQTWQ